MSRSPDNPPSSPACLAHQADDTYMGFATAEEISAFRQALADAQRLGAPSESIIADLRKILPRVREDATFAELKAMLDLKEGRQGAEKQ
jgi:hypothetical protein